MAPCSKQAIPCKAVEKCPCKSRTKIRAGLIDGREFLPSSPDKPMLFYGKQGEFVLPMNIKHRVVPRGIHGRHHEQHIGTYNLNCLLEAINLVPIFMPHERERNSTLREILSHRLIIASPDPAHMRLIRASINDDLTDRLMKPMINHQRVVLRVYTATKEHHHHTQSHITCPHSEGPADGGVGEPGPM